VTALDLAVESRFFALLFSCIVLLALFEKSMRRIVVTETLRSVESIVKVVICRAVAGLKLFQNFAARL
jgi:hypothetical protein